MIKKLLALAAIGMMAGCTERRTVLIDGCKYIETINPNATSSFAHKGNCKNLIHKR